MQAASFFGGTWIVIPAFYVSAGIAFYTGIQALVVGFIGHRVPLYLAFAATCFCAAGFIYASGEYYTATSVAAAGTALRWQGAAALLFLPSFYAFVALFTGQRRVRPWFAAVALVSVAAFVGNFLQSYGIRFAALEAAEPLHLPWGERLVMFSGTVSSWTYPLRAVAIAIFGWALWRAWVQYRRGERRPAAFLAACLLLQLGAIAWASLIDYGVIRSFYVNGFAFLGLVLLMSVCMGMELRDHALALEVTASELRDEIGKRREAETEMRRMAYRDDLTGLANRALLHEHLAEAIARAGAHGAHGAMLLIDLDHFKIINDALSHDVGDDVLREVARRLTEVAGADAFVARLGGDEFVAIMGQTTPNTHETAAAARRLAEAVTRALAAPLTVGERVLTVGASIGIAPFPDNGSTAPDVLRHADMALYRAKHLGRSNVQLFAPPLQAAADERLTMEKGLRRALASDELALHFQPQLDAAGRAIGAEALLRWRHPQRGLIPPRAFIPVAEESGLIHALGTWVLEQACERLTHWACNGVHLDGRLAVNISPWQFTRPDVVRQIDRLLARHGVEPARLTLELTETALLYDLAETVEKLNALRALGIRVALDDFGTGYSSLAYLKSLPVDELKIDEAFVRDIADPAHRPLLESMIAIGRNMRLHVIAEGVESARQRELLLQMGCERFQGRLFCGPVAEPEFLQWLAGGARRADGEARLGA